MTTAKLPYQMNAAELAERSAERRRMLELVRAWVVAAVADGWSIGPTYRHEPVESAARLDHAALGLKAAVLTRAAPPFCCADGTPVVSLNVWDLDNVALDHGVPESFRYDRAALLAAKRTCPVCKATNVETFRVAFANRACAACLPAERARLERRNWPA
jgi:hypothetical protein